MQKTPVFLTERELSQIVKRSIPTLRSDRHYGKGFPYYKNGRQILYKLDEVLEIVENGRIEPSNW